MDRIATTRHAYVTNNGQTVYEWEQNYSEVNIYFKVPPGTRARDLTVDIKPQHLAVGIKGSPPYLDKELGGCCNPGDSLWTLEDGTLSIVFAKREEGATWPSAIAGHELSVLEAQEDQKRAMLERFQAENPGFDFSGAQFNGEVPNARTFMRDLSHS